VTELSPQVRGVQEWYKESLTGGGFSMTVNDKTPVQGDNVHVVVNLPDFFQPNWLSNPR
jgi:hypothetical protein